MIKSPPDEKTPWMMFIGTFLAPYKVAPHLVFLIIFSLKLPQTFSQQREDHTNINNCSFVKHRIRGSPQAGTEIPF